MRPRELAPQLSWQENEWLDTQRRKTDELMDVHVRLVSRSTASMADSIAKVKQVGPGRGINKQGTSGFLRP